MKKTEHRIKMEINLKNILEKIRGRKLYVLDRITYENIEEKKMKYYGISRIFQ